MARSNLHTLVLGSILMLLPFMAQAQVALKDWTTEDHSGEVKSSYRVIHWKLPLRKVLHCGITGASPETMKSAIA